MKPIISKKVRIRHPNRFHVGTHSIVDDFSYFSTQVTVGECSHIASGCTIAGGGRFRFKLGDFSSLSSGVRIWCASDDYKNDVVTILPPGCPPVKSHVIEGDVIFGNFTAVGANSVIMPDNRIPEGTVIGALSFVPSGFKFKPWSVYAGIPIRYRGPRNRRAVLEQARKITAFLKKKS